MTTAPTIRSLTLSETETLMDWARIEGWNPGLADAAAFHAADPQGFIGCFVDGQMAAGISAVRYGHDFGFIGLYIAHPPYRGRGYGRRVWDAAMVHLEGRTIGLDGVREQRANYQSMGFEPHYETFRWSGSVTGVANSDVVAVSPDMAASIADYDRHFFPAERSGFLAQWLKPPRLAMATVRDGVVHGYAVCRKCHDGFKIGPLFADTTVDAQCLLKACAARAEGRTMHIDVPAMQTQFAEILEANGFSKGFATARMYRGPAPMVPMAGVFAVSTLELG
ncbi:GNAT family N-acetyltransferase [Rhizobium sp. LCM 4573]|nr:GNAT family N-acetyltransferase [Rhizobium sp. LCM 4573]